MLKEITKLELIGKIIQLYDKAESVQPVVEEKKVYVNEGLSVEENKLIRLGKETLLDSCFSSYQGVTAQRNGKGNIIYTDKEDFLRSYISKYNLPTYFSIEEIRNIFKEELNEIYLKKCKEAEKKLVEKELKEKQEED